MNLDTIYSLPRGASTRKLRRVQEKEEEFSPLFSAIRRDDAEAVRRLCENGADVDELSAGVHPLFCASVRTAEPLIDHGSHIDARMFPLYNRTALAYMATLGQTDRVDYLASRGADVDALDDHGWTPAMCAARLGHGDCVRALAHRGADLSYTNAEGESALSLAKRHCDRETAEFVEETVARNRPAGSLEEARRCIGAALDDSGKPDTNSPEFRRAGAYFRILAPMGSEYKNVPNGDVAFRQAISDAAAETRSSRTHAVPSDARFR